MSSEDVLVKPTKLQGGLADEAVQLRRRIVEMMHLSGGGHYGGALSVSDILLVLYRRILRANDRVHDRLVLSKGHAAMALYCTLAHCGKLDAQLLPTYGHHRSPLQGHPDMTSLPAIDFSSGSLGQGLSVALGMAIALRNSGSGAWVILGDGECQEGQVWEAAMLAERICPTNLWAVVDCNQYQEYSGASTTREVPLRAAEAKWRAFGWHVVTCDGHDHRALTSALMEVRAAGCPAVLLARTTKGYGFTVLEKAPELYHCACLSTEECERILASERRA
jgi:transketolase